MDLLGLLFCTVFVFMMMYGVMRIASDVIDVCRGEPTQQEIRESVERVSKKRRQRELDAFVEAQMDIFEQQKREKAIRQQIRRERELRKAEKEAAEKMEKGFSKIVKDFFANDFLPDQAAGKIEQGKKD